VGLEGITKADYAEELDTNLQDRMDRMKQMAYRPAPVRRVNIPKQGPPGATGASTLSWLDFLSGVVEIQRLLKKERPFLAEQSGEIEVYPR
jgi:hypothetical protein